MSAELRALTRLPARGPYLVPVAFCNTADIPVVYRHNAGGGIAFLTGTLFLDGEPVTAGLLAVPHHARPWGRPQTLAAGATEIFDFRLPYDRLAPGLY